MKLRDLKSLNRSTPVNEPEEDYLLRLRQEEGGKQKVVGAGAYATVFQHPEHEHMAVKVSEESINMIRWFKYVIQNQDNPFVPKVYHVKRFIGPKRRWGKRSKYFIVFMEKLKPYDDLSNKKKAEMISQAMGIQVYNFTRDMEDFFDWKSPAELAKMVRTNTPARRQLHSLLMALSKLNANDMHDGNIMLRGNQLVFTDPTT